MLSSNPGLILAYNAGFPRQLVVMRNLTQSVHYDVGASRAQKPKVASSVKENNVGNRTATDALAASFASHEPRTQFEVDKILSQKMIDGVDKFEVRCVFSLSYIASEWIAQMAAARQALRAMDFSIQFQRFKRQLDLPRETCRVLSKLQVETTKVSCPNYHKFPSNRLLAISYLLYNFQTSNFKFEFQV
jgi:hypothetical protein